MSPLPARFAILLLAIPAAFAIGAARADDPVLAQYKDAVVTKSDFDAYMERVPAHMQREARADGERNEKVVDLIFTNRILAQEARAKGLDKDPVMAKRIEQQVEAFLAQQYTARMEREVPIPPNLEARARELYIVSPERYTEPPRMGLHHILVDLNGRTREMALQRAREIRAKALAGEDFLELAARYSNDPGLKINNGNIGFPSKDELEPPVSEAGFRLKADGEISEIAETRFGFHILKRVGFKPGHVRKFEEVKDTIIEDQIARLRSDVSLKHIDAIRRSPEIRWNAAAVAGLRTELSQEELEKVRRQAARLKEEEAKAKAMSGTAPKK